MVSKGLSSHFQIGHTLTMSSVSPTGYRFNATYVGPNQISPEESYPVLLGDISPNGSLNANIIQSLNASTRLKIHAQFDEGLYGRCNHQFIFEHKGSDYTAACSLVNADPISMSGIAVLQYLQSVTPTIDVGTELAYQRSPMAPPSGMAVVSMAGRWKDIDDKCSLSGTISTHRINLCYFQKAMDKLDFAVEVETDLRESASVGTLGYKYELPEANMLFKGSFNSNWTATAVLEKRLLPLPFTFSISGQLTHGKKSDFKLGCGLQIG